MLSTIRHSSALVPVALNVPAGDSSSHRDFLLLSSNSTDRPTTSLLSLFRGSWLQHACLLQSTGFPVLHGNKLPVVLLTNFAVQRNRCNAVQRLTTL